jgi:eukaryotic-like serine/threonine-protein kinase
METLTVTAGPLPRVLLRDTENFNGPGPVVLPSSSEMPDHAERTGRLQLLGEIARGGMGAILKGRDNDLGRDLAVKVLLERHGDNSELLRRFVEEAQIAGQLQHPGVVPVYELGTFTDRRPYFAMKLVKGRTLAELLAERADPSSDHPRLLAIFLDVAQTMAYAHARGVIHRDLKPSNVMVGSFGEVQVMDWGLAKVLPRGGATDDARAGKLEIHETVIATARSGSGSDLDLSHAGSVLGTPSYMAPEQARGENDQLDERADVFALGSILCEILTGQPAFAGRSSAEILRLAARGDLSGAWKRLDGSLADAELVALARDTLAPEADDRPHDAGAIVDRLSGYLSGVQEKLRIAERERAVADARAVEERRRRKLQVGLAASILALATVGGLGAAASFQQRQARAAAFARSLGEAESLVTRAVASPEDVARWREATAAASRVDSSQVGGSSARDRLTRIKAEAEEGLLAAERDAVLRQSLVDIRANQQDAGAAQTDAAYAKVFHDAGLDVDAASVAEVAARLRKRSPAVVVELAAYLDHWAVTRRGNRRPPEIWKKPLEVARAADADPFRDRVRSLLASEDHKAVADELSALAIDPRSGELAAPTALLLSDALDKAEARVALLRKAVERHPDDLWANFSLAGSLNGLRPRPREEIIRYYSVARALRPETSHDLAHELERVGRGEEAEATYRDLVTRQPENVRYLSDLGRFLKARGQLDEGNAVLDRAVAAGRRAVAQRPGESLVHSQLAAALMAQGNRDEGFASYRLAIGLQPDDAAARISMGNVLNAEGKWEQAIAEYRKAIEFQPNHAFALSGLVSALLNNHQKEEANTVCREWIQVSPGDASAHISLGNVLNAEGKREEAIAEFREAIRLQPDHAVALSNLVSDLLNSQRNEEAITVCREWTRVRPGEALAYHQLGAALNRIGRRPEEIAVGRAEAIAAWREAVRLDPNDRIVWYWLGVQLNIAGEFAPSAKALRRALELTEGSIPADAAPMLARVEKYLKLEPRLPAVLKGEERPKDVAETILFARMCDSLQRFAASVRFYEQAFAEDRSLAENPDGLRLRAARSALKGGCLSGKDDPPLDEAGRARLREKGMKWLREELVKGKALLEKGPDLPPGPQGKPQTSAKLLSDLRDKLEEWKKQRDFAEVRDHEGLAKLPESERKDWQAFWAEVDALILKTQDKKGQ